MDDLTRLTRIAQDLIVRIRDDDPESNARWLALVLPNAGDWFRLAFMLAAAVPDDRSWSQLTRWTMPDSPQVIAERRRQLDVALRRGEDAA
jgi:hypothetical protein